MGVNDKKVYWFIILLILFSSLTLLTAHVFAGVISEDTLGDIPVTLEEVKRVHAYVRGLPMPPRSCVKRSIMIQDVFDKRGVENLFHKR